MQPEEMVGQTLGHYRILRPLGYGGSAAVFLALDINLQREVAVKVFQPSEGEAQDFLRRFVREARVLAQLDHPNILPIYDYGEQDDRAFLVVPYMAGGSLREWLRGRGSVPAQEVLRLIGQVLAALQYAHDRGLIHRDIKPGNMLFKADGALLLADFGLVKITTAQGTMPPLDTTRSMSAHTISGTPEYMAPEQINGRVVPASDIYAMGVVLYQMMTGVRPFRAETYVAVLMKQLYEQPQPLRSLNPRISPALEAVVMRTLEKDPARRYQRPMDLRRDLEQAIAAEQADTASTPAWPVTAPSSPGAPPPSRHGASSNEQAAPPPVPMAFSEQVSQAARQSAPVTPSGQTPTSLSDLGLSPAAARTAPAHRARSLLVGLLVLALLIATGLGGVLYGRGAFGPHPQPGQEIKTPLVTPRQGGTVTGGTPGGAAGGATATVLPVSTSCPASGTARAAVMPPLAQQGNDQNVVYISNEGAPGNPGAATLARYDVTARTTSTISKLPSTFIREAQVSQNGQWALVSASVAGQYELRMVRIDGQELQTLYCAPSNADIFGVQWSFDQKSIIFDVGPHLSVVFLLNAGSGKLQQELSPSGNVSYVARTWLDNTRIYMVSMLSDTEAPLQNEDLYILDTSKGANQQGNNLQKIATILPACGSFDTSYNSAKLFISACSASASGASGPSKITAQAATGGATTTVTTIPQAVAMLRSVTPTTLLLLIENSSGDTTHNGLWRMNSDGTGLKRLTTDSSNAQSLCQFTQYSWSNVSPDGSMYALQSYDPKTQTYSLSYGLLNGGALNQVIASASGTELQLAGWTKV